MKERKNTPNFEKHPHKTKHLPRKKNDELLKGAFQDYFFEFLRFVYPDAEDVVDFSKGIELMDKELFSLISDRERKNDRREADLLVKLHLKGGSEKWVLLDLEIEGGNENDFAFRLFQYWYRIRDRFRVSAATIVVFIGGKTQKRPTEYHEELLGTLLSFKYTTYHVFDHNAAALLKSRNAFALLALACQTALLEGKIPEEELGKKRLAIARMLIKHNYDRDKIMRFMWFLKNFIFIEDKEINLIFDKAIYELTKGGIDMGIIETIKMQERREGKAEGAKEKSYSIVENLIKKLGLSDAQTADIAEVTIAFVKKVRKEIEAKRNTRP